MKKLLFVTLLVNASAVLAATTLLEVPVTYHPNAGVVAAVKQECQIESMLSTRVGSMLGKLNKTGDGTIETGLEASDNTLLRLQITHILGVGGGAWTGPKAITLTAELLENGKVSRKTKINRWSVGGVFGAFKGSCTILERCADAITKDLSRWVQNPAYKIVEQPAPKEAVEAGIEVEKPAEVIPAMEAPPAPDVPQAAEPKETN
ncbi:MAG: hypothetical protein H6R17_2940 [Proteobacteria bacterium]|nr:hypothetical protein [Pseudomonadota bacterium]